jgi:hypothetical protein
VRGELLPRCTAWAKLLSPVHLGVRYAVGQKMGDVAGTSGYAKVSKFAQGQQTARLLCVFFTLVVPFVEVRLEGKENVPEADCVVQ